MAKRKNKFSLSVFEANLRTVVLILLLIAVCVLYFTGFYKKLLGIPSFATITQTKVLTPSDDTYVSKSAPNKNYGVSKGMNVSSVPEIAYLKFDLSTLADLNIASAVLRLRATSKIAVVDQKVQKVDDTTWTEKRITFNNRPIENSSLGEYSANLNVDWFEYNLTDLVKASAGKKLSLVVKTPATKAIFYSKESGSKPQLKVDYLVDVTPTPTGTPYNPPDISQEPTGPELLTNPGFEGSYSSLAPNWSINAWSGSSYTGTRVIGRTGGYAQKLNVSALPSDSGVLLKQTKPLPKGHVYRFSVWLRSDTDTDVEVIIRNDNPYYHILGAKRLKVGSAWQQVVIRGGFHDNVDLTSAAGLYFKTTGSLEIDDASLVDITDYLNNGPVSNKVIPPTFFGMHFNKPDTLRNADYLPPINFGLVRLWDDVITWKDLEPSNNSWDFSRFDMIVNYLTAKSPNTKLLYTLGMTPSWARLNSSDAGSEPRDINDWREYVRTVGTRYKNKIQYYEIWNESDVSLFSSISPQKMVELTRAANEELEAIDPNIKIISPNIDTLGLGYLDDFLFYGGGQYVDILSYHIYTHAAYPEDSLGFHYGVQSLRDNYGLSGLPVWNTEGNLFYPSGYGTDTQDRASVARYYLINWASGAENFSWYTWDIFSWDGNYQVRLATDNYLNTRPGGIAYREVANWLIGNRMISKEFNNGLYHMSVQTSQGKTNHIVWKYNTPGTFTIPAEWNVGNMQDLSGNQTSLTSQSSINIGLEPVILLGN